MGKLSIVTDGMYGSCGKGHLVADLTHESNNSGPVVCVRPGAHQAGHTAIGLDGQAWALRQVPVAAVVNRSARLFIAAGSEVSPETLLDEIHRLDAVGFDVSSRLVIDGAATWLTQEHIDQENADGMASGSTKKGVGAARAARIWRKAQTIDQCLELARWTEYNTGQMLTAYIREDWHCVIEGVQGNGLNVHGPAYPNSTSGDCRAIDFLAQCGISPWADGLPKPEIWVIVRPYPIRIAGASGELKGETTWDALGLPEEITTVTKKVRRVGAWDPDLVRQAVLDNGGNVKLAFSMADQVFPEVAGWDGFDGDYPFHAALSEWVRRVEDAAGDNSMVCWVGTGPGTSVMATKTSTQPPKTAVVVDSKAAHPLQEWWVKNATDEAPMIAEKADRYGSNSLAAMGRMLAELQRDSSNYSYQDFLELGCFAYAYGKAERVFDAIKRGEFPDIDSWRDLSVYSRMAIKVRETGSWP